MCFRLRKFKKKKICVLKIIHVGYKVSLSKPWLVKDITIFLFFPLLDALLGEWSSNWVKLVRYNLTLFLVVTMITNNFLDDITNKQWSWAKPIRGRGVMSHDSWHSEFWKAPVLFKKIYAFFTCCSVRIFQNPLLL